MIAAVCWSGRKIEIEARSIHRFHGTVVPLKISSFLLSFPGRRKPSKKHIAVILKRFSFPLGKQHNIKCYVFVKKSSVEMDWIWLLRIQIDIAVVPPSIVSIVIRSVSDQIGFIVDGQDWCRNCDAVISLRLCCINQIETVVGTD